MVWEISGSFFFIVTDTVGSFITICTLPFGTLTSSQLFWTNPILGSQIYWSQSQRWMLIYVHNTLVIIQIKHLETYTDWLLGKPLCYFCRCSNWTFVESHFPELKLKITSCFLFWYFHVKATCKFEQNTKLIHFATWIRTICMEKGNYYVLKILLVRSEIFRN